MKNKNENSGLFLVIRLVSIYWNSLLPKVMDGSHSLSREEEGKEKSSEYPGPEGPIWVAAAILVLQLDGALILFT